MSRRLLNTWLPISEFPFTVDDSLSFQGKPDTWSPNKILLYGYEKRDPSKQMKIWSLDSLYEQYEDMEDGSKKPILFCSESWMSGDWLRVIPSMYMEVTPPEMEKNDG